MNRFKLKFNPDLTEEELDRELWKNTKYEGLSFVRESSWIDYDNTYGSPVFAFENGDRVVFDRFGNIKVL